MIRNVLSHTSGISTYGVIAIVLFFTTFAGMLIWVCSRKRSLMQELGALPLADDETPQTELETSRDESVQ